MTNRIENEKDLLHAYQFAKLFLEKKSEPTIDDLEIAAERAIIQAEVEIEKSVLVRKLEASMNIWVGPGTVLEAAEVAAHHDWLKNRKSEIAWKFWERYSAYLRSVKDRPKKIVDELDRITDQILSMLEDPTRQGPWSRRGMVVGHVQSGKTANYTGLICKAADAGYNLIIVLAGIHNSLRSQTQQRLDEEFLGFDSRLKLKGDAPEGNRIGVGKMFVDSAFANTATCSDNNGDFKGTVANQSNLILGGTHPTLLVIKKNKTVLENVIKWATAHRSKRTPSGKKLVADIPLLIIDDEADQASINTDGKPLDESGQLDPNMDPTAINAAIRKLLSSFEQNAYIGYTATPFANIFIHPDNSTIEHGKDLFPASFIVNLPAPTDYIGPEEFFQQTEITREQSGIKIVPSEEEEEWLGVKQKKSTEPNELPKTLIEALQVFFLICAIRRLRRQENEHNSMLIHVTRFKEVQTKVSAQVKEKVAEFQSRIKNHKKNSADLIFEEFHAVWKNNLSHACESDKFEWDEIRNALIEAARKIKCRTINGDSKDILDYADSSEPLSVIAIGGNKLSRGLTLDGLSVSYYLRASKMYDTLMQMGRWFGYRPGYGDLCKLYTTADLVSWYLHITEASRELREEFDEMAFRGDSPLEFGLKVKTHPSGLQITSVNKMRSGIDMKVAYADSTNETVTFEKGDVRNNFECAADFIGDLQDLTHHQRSGDQENDSIVWKNVPPHLICRFLRTIKTPTNARRCYGPFLAKYIDEQNTKNELTNWTVVLISKKKANKTFEIGNLTVGLLTRAPLHDDSQVYRIRRLVSGKDLTLDLTADQVEQALKLSNESRSSRSQKLVDIPDDSAIRKVRDVTNGLLLLYPLDFEFEERGYPVIGFSVSFPDSLTAAKIDYKVNNVYHSEEFAC